MGRRLIVVMKAPLLILVLVGLPTVVTPQIAKQGAGYLFRSKYTAGKTLRYTMLLSSTSGGQTVLNMETPLVMATKSVAKGVATIEVSTGPAKMNGQSQGKVDKQTVKMDSRNRPVGGQSNFEGFGSFAFPEKPVAIGSKWSQKVDMGTAMGQLKMDANYTFAGVKTLGGTRVAEIRTTMSGNMMGPITGRGTSYIVLADGSLHSSTVQLTMKVTAGETTQTIVSNIKVSRK